MRTCTRLTDARTPYSLARGGRIEHYGSPAERGSAMVFAIFLMLVCALLTTMIAVNLANSTHAAKARSSRFTGVPAIDSAISKYQTALQSNDLDPTVGLMTSAQMNQMKSPGAHVVANSELASGAYAAFAPYKLSQTMVPAQYAYTMVSPTPTATSAGQEYTFWQVYGVHAPSFASGGSSDLIVYFRGWEAGKNGSAYASPSTPHVARVEFRPGRFSDYEFLTDGPLGVSTGAKINGEVHSNGFMDATVLHWPFAPETLKMLSGSSCGPGASFSTASGTIDRSGGAGCAGAPQKPNTHEVYNFLRAQDMITAMKKRCGTNVVCAPAPATGVAVPNTVRLAGSNVTVNGRTHSAINGLGVLVTGNTRVYGTLSSGAATIVAQKQGGTYGSASIIISGPMPFGAASAGKASVGLIAAGDITLAVGDSYPCATSVDAAMIAEAGAISVPPQYRVPQTSGSGRTCPSLRVQGSLSAHLGVLTSITGTTSAGAPFLWAGFARRNYSYDKRLATNPPPFFPLTGPWQVLSWKDANDACLTTAGWQNVACS